MRLLFITQKIDHEDDDLAFTILWVQEFIKQGFDVSVICLEKGAFNNSFPVYSLGKEKGVGRIGRMLRFLKLIFTLKYDRVFVHMNPEYFTFGGWWWVLMRTPSYLWYTHYTLTAHLRVAAWVAQRLFAATPQSLPQYARSKKRVVLGHGIDLNFWGNGTNKNTNPKELIAVHRLSRSKRTDRSLRVLALLPEDYTLTIYGRPIDSLHFSELQVLVKELGVSDRVTFKGPVRMSELKTAYSHYRLMLNLATETIDKTMLEGMVFGVYPVTTPGNARAIGLSTAPLSDEPAELARYITSKEWAVLSPEALHRLVRERHSLSALVAGMSSYIRPGV